MTAIRDLDLTSGQALQFENYLALLTRWNARTNLTAVRDPAEIVQRHFAQCIFAARQIPAQVGTLLDFGSGAGLPGIPIAICRPDIGVTLAESQGKKAAFLREAVRTLEIKAEVWPHRVEAMPRERVFDAVTLRAVDRMADACRLAVQRLASGGWLAVLTTRKAEAALEKLRGIQWEAATPIPGSAQEILKTGILAPPGSR